MHYYKLYFFAAFLKNWKRYAIMLGRFVAVEFRLIEFTREPDFTTVAFPWPFLTITLWLCLLLLFLTLAFVLHF